MHPRELLLPSRRRGGGASLCPAVADKWNSRQLRLRASFRQGPLTTLCLAALQMFEHVCETLKGNGLGRREDIFLLEELIDLKNR